MTEESNGKLIRDKYPNIFKKKGEDVQTRILDESEKLSALLGKLLEESGEVFESGGDIEELADVLQVIMAIVKEKGMSLTDLEQARLKKLNQKGGFEKGIYLIYDDIKHER